MHAVAAGVALALAILLAVIDTCLVLGEPGRWLYGVATAAAALTTIVGGFLYLLRKPSSLDHVVLRGSLLNGALVLPILAHFLNALRNTHLDGLFAFVALVPAGFILLVCLVLGSAATRRLWAVPGTPPGPTDSRAVDR